MKKFKRVLALVLASAMMLTACGGSDGSTNSGSKGDEQKEQITNLVTYQVAALEMEKTFILNSENAADLDVMCSLWDGLLEIDTEGKLMPGIAEKWETTDGGRTWTFNLRQGVKWVDVNGEEKGEVTAQDWITALEWVMNFHKNNAFNTSMPIALIEGAADYYNYTKELSQEDAYALDKTKFLEMVGIEAPDDYTLIYHCNAEHPYFDTVATSACLYPVSQAWIDEVGVENVLSAGFDKLWYNGPYTMTTFTHGNEKILTQNPLYWDKDCSLFETVTVKMVDDANVAYQLFENGEIDTVALAEATLRTIYDDENHKYHDYLAEQLPRKYSYQFHLNYDKYTEDGTPDTNHNKAMGNENFRKALYYGLDLTKYWERTNFIDPQSCSNLAYTMQGLLYFSDGTEYTAKVKEKLGLGDTRLDSSAAQSYKEQAMEELAAEGVTFPVQLDHYIPAGNQSALDTATVLQQIFSECLGDDFVQLNIKTYVSSYYQEVASAKLQSFAINGWGADYGDPDNFLGQETYGEDAAYYSNNYSNINETTDADLIATYKEFTELVKAAREITTDLDARYEAFAEAEAYMLDHALAIPCMYSVGWQLTKINDYSKGNAMFGMQNNRYKNWVTSVDAYTTEEYEKLAEEAGK